MMSAGKPRSVSYRANASNGEVVSTPPKSQITASIIILCPWSVRFRERLTRNADRNQPEPPLGVACCNGYFCGMKFPIPAMASLLLVSSPAYAIVGSGAPSIDGVARSVVTIVGSRGNFCTGAVIAPKLVLTAAHCVQPGADYKIVEYGSDRQPSLQDVKTVAVHPGFNMQTMLAHRATADVALLLLDTPAKGKAPAPLGAPNIPIIVGSRFTIAGIGVTVRGDGKSGGAIRVAGL